MNPFQANPSDKKLMTVSALYLAPNRVNIKLKE
jgi:hypothetical protein